MKENLSSFIMSAAWVTCLPVALLVTSCSSTPKPASRPASPTSTPASYSESNQGLGGEVVTDAISRTATILSVDRVKRLVVVKRPNGREVTYKAAPNAIGFEVIQPGDVVKVSVAEELAVFVGKNSVPPGAGADSARLRVHLPGNTQAVATEVSTLAFTAKITALNYWQDTVTIQLPDGLTKTVRVSEYVNLADFNVGDDVAVRVTEAAVLLLEKP